ncbi:relaxase/mobilization nuclease domain-containing protein [Comamonas sp. JUb58]|uniref:relaxase/mobilization nuclease domain-containing protein n=1 Tax=Comamonas sp. JUb58 TaxID=2485114 RepID=UPI001061FF8A|nr:relaxase/mobilization nuclease domain-containing protein [Comamonas sp. JUb58]TDS70820.1 relaxase/mobilization nuclease-like protein [Comamonas sp. JUb58]
MIIKIFKNVGKGPSKGPINYLLGKDSEGKERAIKPAIFQGCRHSTAFLIDQNHRENKYTSGVVAYRHNEKPSYEQIKEMCDDFQKTFLPNMSNDDVPILWVLHREKGNTELHFLIPKQTSKGQAFNAFPPGAKNMDLMKSWQVLQNDKSGYKQVTSDGFSSSFEAFEKKTRKPQFSKKIKQMAKDGKIKNRADLINYLNTNGHKVTRAGQDYISVKFADKEKSMRFQGEIFKPETDYNKLLNTFQNTELSRLDRAINTNKLEKLKAERSTFNLKRYQSPKKPRFENTRRKNSRSFIKNEGIKSRLSCSSEHKQPSSYNTTSQPIKTNVAPSMPSLEAKGESLPPNLQERSELAPTPKPSLNFDNFKNKLSNISVNSTHQSSSSLSSFDSQIASLLSKMAGVKDPLKLAELQQKIAVLRAKQTEQAYKEKHDKEKQNSRIKIG